MDSFSDYPGANAEDGFTNEELLHIEKLEDPEEAVAYVENETSGGAKNDKQKILNQACLKYTEGKIDKKDEYVLIANKLADTPNISKPNHEEINLFLSRPSSDEGGILHATYSNAACLKRKNAGIPFTTQPFPKKMPDIELTNIPTTEEKAHEPVPDEERTDIGQKAADAEDLPEPVKRTTTVEDVFIRGNQRITKTTTTITTTTIEVIEPVKPSPDTAPNQAIVPEEESLNLNQHIHEQKILDFFNHYVTPILKPSMLYRLKNYIGYDNKRQSRSSNVKSLAPHNLYIWIIDILDGGRILFKGEISTLTIIGDKICGLASQLEETTAFPHKLYSAKIVDDIIKNKVDETGIRVCYMVNSDTSGRSDKEICADYTSINSLYHHTKDFHAQNFSDKCYHEFWSEFLRICEKKINLLVSDLTKIALTSGDCDIPTFIRNFEYSSLRRLKKN